VKWASVPASLAFNEVAESAKFLALAAVIWETALRLYPTSVCFDTPDDLSPFRRKTTEGGGGGRVGRGLGLLFGSFVCLHDHGTAGLDMDCERRCYY
jgi:hypothetical protein